MSGILVTGATGNVGRAVIRRLVEAGAAVRAFARRADALDGVPAVAGDLSDAASLEPAAIGMEMVFLVWPFLTTERAPAVLDVLRRHARQVVYLSSSGVGEQDDPINDMHAGMERLIERSGPEWTMLRSATIASNARGWAEQIRTTGIVRGPEVAPSAVIHEDDVAAVAARVLVGGGYAGERLVLTGPAVVDRSEHVQAIGDAIGRRLRFEPVPIDAARRQLLADGRPPALVDALLASATARPRSNVVTRTVEQITGSPARTIHQWALDHAHEFR